MLPAALWEESGRYESVGSELMRFTDRNDNPLVLGMTHEEAAVHLVREYGKSYTKYPFMIYQIQTKFRDEARPRAGLIRVREFTMKDAYSFHTSQEDLEAYYERCFHAYERIFARAGLPEVISVASDSGMMGGSLSHEFMLLTPVGEDSIAVCGCCDYRANMEAAESIVRNVRDEVSQPLTRVYIAGHPHDRGHLPLPRHPDGEELQGRRLPAQRGRLLHRAFYPRRSRRERNKATQLYRRGCPPRRQQRRTAA